MPKFKCPCGVETEAPEGPFVCSGCGKAGMILHAKPGRPDIATALRDVLEASMESGDLCRFRYDDYELSERDEDAPVMAEYMIHFDGTVDAMKFIYEFHKKFYPQMEIQTGDPNADPAAWFRQISE